VHATGNGRLWLPIPIRPRGPVKKWAAAIALALATCDAPSSQRLAEPGPAHRSGLDPAMSFDFDAKIADWRTQLLDTSRRNPLIYFRTGKGSSGCHDPRPRPIEWETP
jgi:hypothetical protein